MTWVPPLYCGRACLIFDLQLGIGTTTSIPSLASVFQSGYHLYWVDATTGSSTSNASPQDIMSRVTQDFAPWQLAAVQQLESPADIPPACQQNFNGYSECWAAILFSDVEGFNERSINYTIRADAGLWYVNVQQHTSDVEVRVLPLQWALDSAIISLQTGRDYSTPEELPFTNDTNEDQKRKIRLGYIDGIRELFVLVLYVSRLHSVC